MRVTTDSEAVMAAGPRRRASWRAVPERRMVAEARWLGARASLAWKRRFVVPHAVTPTRTPDRFAAARVERDVRVPMRDGVTLSAHVFHPAGAARPLPVVLIRQPYGKDDHPVMHARGTYWARKGYVCAIQDVRGKYGSGGRWEPVVNEARDGWDTIDWIAAQPWCDGNIGMAGESYHGLTQWAVAGAGHPNLRCVAPGDTVPDLYQAAYPGGAFALMTMGEWAYEMNARRLRNPFRFDPWHLPLIEADDAAGARSRVFKEFVTHCRRDAYWEKRDLSRGGVVVPGLHWSGWYDVFLGGSLGGWRAATARHGAGAQIQQLVIGPTDHALGPMSTGRVGRITVGREHWSFDREQRFFDRWLREERNGAERDPAVQVYVVGGGRWRTADSWPLPGTELTRLYLRGRGGAAARGGGGLSRHAPCDEPSDRFSYDPGAPVTYWLHRSLWELAAELDDRRSLEARPDVLVYSSPALTTDLEVVGPVSATLYVSTSAPDTDFTAALVDVFPDGFAQLVQEGIVRLGSVDHESSSSQDGDGVHELAVDLCATGHLFATGHAVRLEVSSSNFGRYDRNLNTGGAPGLAVRQVVARQTVYHDGRRPSCLTLPVVPTDGRPRREPPGPPTDGGH